MGVAPKTPLKFRILPRNDGILDGILEFPVMRSLGQARG